MDKRRGLSSARSKATFCVVLEGAQVRRFPSLEGLGPLLPLSCLRMVPRAPLMLSPRLKALWHLPPPPGKKPSSEGAAWGGQEARMAAGRKWTALPHLRAGAGGKE